MENFLKKLPLFAHLSPEDLTRLCQMVEQIDLPAEAQLFEEGDHGNHAYVIQEGEIEIIKRSGDQDVLLAVRHSGDVIGEMSLLEESPRNASAQARTDCRLIAIGKEQFDQLLNSSPTAARAMLQTITSRLRSTEAMLRQSDKLAELGTLTAGVAHELNNPASAVQRGAVQLQQSIAGLQKSYIGLNRLGLSPPQLETLNQLNQHAQDRAGNPIDVDPLTRSDLESDLESWLEDRGHPRSWDCAPALVNLGCTSQELEDLVSKFPDKHFNLVLDWVTSTFTTYSMLAEINQGADRIIAIVNAMKQYVYLDQAPIQGVNVHEGLDNTLILLRSKLKTGVNVRREYHPNLPQIQAYGSELNQLWTNLIDNAYDAMQGKGDIVIRTRPDGEWVVVEIEDNGPGIPESIQSRVFDPFFTTKEPGKGTGLGLNISYNIVQKHYGVIKLHSKPGKTRFEVRLPINSDEIKKKTKMIKPFERPEDDTLFQILQNTRTIAVVGLSDREETFSNSVSGYLQRQGYRIIPINPSVEVVLDEKAYKDLLEVPDPVDLVLLFRRSEFVPPHVKEAIQIGADVVWMQEGIAHEIAADTAQKAGLKVVMDTCIRTVHRRYLKTLEKSAGTHPPGL